MTKDEWKKIITKKCKEAGTYKEFFDLIIEQLSQIMETRDAAKEAYRKTDSQPVILHTNKAGHTNIIKNPALAVINDCNQQALSYWRDLGLTPTGYKRLNPEEVIEKEKTFEEMLSRIGI